MTNTFFAALADAGRRISQTPTAAAANSSESSASLAKLKPISRKAARALYHEVWKTVGDNFFEHERLVGWDKWEHRFDEEIKTLADAIKLANKMLRSLKDTYTWLRAPSDVESDQDDVNGVYIGAGFLSVKRPTGSLITEVYPGSPAEYCGLHRGDLLTNINGRPVSKMTDEEMIRRFRGREGTGVRITFTRSGYEWRGKLVRGKVATSNVHTKILENNVGYLRLDCFLQKTTVRKMRRALRRELNQCPALIIDLRGNGGGFINLALDCASMFLRNGRLVTITERIKGQEGQRHLDYYVGRRGLATHTCADNAKCRDGVRRRQQCLVRAGVKVIILVDGETGSAAEIFVGALQDNGRAVVIGVPTTGKGIGQTSYTTAQNTELSVTNMRYCTPSGHWPGDAQRTRNRLQPDVVVEGKGRLHRCGLKRDKQLSAACQYLSEQS